MMPSMIQLLFLNDRLGVTGAAIFRDERRWLVAKGTPIYRSSILNS
jgi:hypothetical protein